MLVKGDRLLFQVYGNGDEFQIYFSMGGTLKNLASILKNDQLRMRLPAKPGVFATSFLAQVPHTEVCLVGSERVEYDLLVRFGSTMTPRLAIVNACTRSGELYRGPLNNFIVWAEQQNSLSGLLKKVVAFDYHGGSRNGKRTIRVERVEQDSIEGYDLAQDDLDKAYRRYSINKIHGDIAVLT